MQNRFDFAVRFSDTVKNENIGGIILDIDALKTDDSVCDIKDLNKASIDLTIQRTNGAKDVSIFSGYLGDLIAAMYTQSTLYDIYTKKYANGYKVKLNFSALPIVLKGDESLKIDCYFGTDTFEALSKTKSSVSVETIPSIVENPTRVIPLIQSYNVAEGRDNFEESLGNSVRSVIIATDLKETFLQSTNAKALKVDLFAQNFDKSVTDNALFVENLEMLSINPDSEVRNLVVYRGQKPLNNVKLKVKFDDGVAKGTKILVTKLQRF